MQDHELPTGSHTQQAVEQFKSLGCPDTSLTCPPVGLIFFLLSLKCFRVAVRVQDTSSTESLGGTCTGTLLCGAVLGQVAGGGGWLTFSPPRWALHCTILRFLPCCGSE